MACVAGAVAHRYRREAKPDVGVAGGEGRPDPPRPLAPPGALRRRLRGPVPPRRDR
jgi:hypothetical protein